MLCTLNKPYEEGTAMKRKNGSRDSDAPVTWEEVWSWLDDIEEKWGYSGVVTVSRPLGSKPDVRYTVALKFQCLRVDDPRMGSLAHKWRSVENSRLSAETVALQMAVEVHRSLDMAVWQAEQAAFEAGALL